MLRRSLRHFVKNLKFSCRTVSALPHPNRVKTGGEDSYFATEAVLAVFDGVGWWDNLGVDSGAYSMALAKRMMEGLKDEYFDEPPAENASLTLLKYAYDHTKRNKGTSTALVMSMIPGNTLDILNLGDCTALILRDGKIVFESEEQVHDLNMPFQLGEGSHDVPEMGLHYTFDAKPGDLVLLATDGIFDNIYRERVAAIVSKCAVAALVKEWNAKRTRRLGNTEISLHDSMSEAMNAAGNLLLREARMNANDPRVATPFADKCLEGGAYYQGGKMDDMTIVMSYLMAPDGDGQSGERVTRANSSPPAPYRGWP